MCVSFISRDLMEIWDQQECRVMKEPKDERFDLSTHTLVSTLV